MHIGIAAIVALNAAIAWYVWDKLEQTQGGEENDPGVLFSKALAQMNGSEIAKIGEMFFQKKVSEVLMDKEVQEVLEFDNSTWSKEQYVSGFGLNLLNVHVSRNEKNNKALDKTTVTTMAERLLEHGVFISKSLFDRERCKRLAEMVHADIMDPWLDYGAIMENRYRKDYPLELRDDYLLMLQDISKLLKPVLESVIGPASTLKEFSSLTTYPGAGTQDFHPDAGMDHPTEIEQLARLFSVFIYLDDVEEDRAPFDAYPGTHTHYHFLSDEEKQMMISAPFARLAVPAGTVAIYDSRLLHRGSGNTSNKTRPTLYLSFLESGKPLPDGPTYSIREEYRDLTIDNIIAGDVPLIDIDKDQQNDEQCLQSMQKRCPSAENGNDLFQCVIDIFEDEDEDEDEQQHLPGCRYPSRMEKVAKANIFQPNFSVYTSWGRL